MRIISIKEEREQLIKSLVSEETNLVPLDRKDCDYLKDAEIVIEYTFKTDLVSDENRVSELLKIVHEADLSNIKGFPYLYFVVRFSPTYEITMGEMSDISKGLKKMCNDEASILWTATYENSLDCNLELVIVIAG
ncbi:MAG: hypothetical protein ACLTSL_05110 [Odoribacter splanchnicus]